MDRSFATETFEEDGAKVLAVQGEVDMESSPALLKSIVAALKGITTLKLRLANVTYLDSSGIAVLIQGLKEAKERKVAFVLSQPSDAVRSVLELASLEGFFQMEPSV